MGQEVEYWKNISGHEGVYMISNTGFVKSIGRKGSGCSKNDIILSNSICKDGIHYPSVNLRKCKKSKMHMVHRLVATAFIENPHNLPQVNHKDGNKNNNNSNNLEWVSPSENIIHGLKLGIMNTAKGSQKKNSIFTEDEVLKIKQRLSNGEIAFRIAKELGVNKENILGIKNGRTWKHVLV